MKYLNYYDGDDNHKSDDYERKIDKALDDAIASLLVDGFVISEEQRQEIKRIFLNDNHIELLYKRRYYKNVKR